MLWQRPLGDGYSGIVVDDERLYTLYREGDDEVAVALDPDTGRTIWTRRHPAPIDVSIHPGSYGYGPRSTPLLLGSRIYTIDFNGRMRCLDKATGEPMWSVDLIAEFGGTVRRWGYACSPLAYGDTVIVLVGGQGAGVVALDRHTGETVWQRHDFENSYASPVLVGVGGQVQLVCFMARDIVGLDPSDGDLIWQHPHENQWRNNIVNPVWGPDNLLFVASEGHGGGRVLEFVRDGATTTVRELWHSRKLRMSHRNAVRIGDYVYATTGDFGPAFFTAVHVRTGRVAWRKRGYAKAALVPVDGRLLVLEETGRLTLATATPEVLTIHGHAQVLSEPAWTPPALVAGRLYLRDRVRVMALELPGDSSVGR